MPVFVTVTLSVLLDPATTLPNARLEGVTENPGASMTMAYVRVPEQPKLSTASTVNVEGPAVDGVPEIVPLSERESPDGRFPDNSENV